MQTNILRGLSVFVSALSPGIDFHRLMTLNIDQQSCRNTYLGLLTALLIGFYSVLFPQINCIEYRSTTWEQRSLMLQL